MNFTELRKQFEKIKRKTDTFEEMRVQSAYLDVLLFADLANELSEEVKDKNIFEMGGDPDKIHAVTERYQQLAAILRAIHLFANIFYEVLLIEVTNRPKLTLKRFLEKPDPGLMNLTTQKILPAYCVVAYRHKVIAHNEIRRLNSWRIDSGGRDMRLWPMPERLQIDDDDCERIEQLKDKYKDDIKGLRGENNYSNLLGILFYGVPLGELGNMNQDRRKIDKIAEAGGCISMTADEILVATDDFIAAVIDAM